MRAVPRVLPLFLVLLSGCASILPIEPPDVALVDLEFTDLTLFETSGVFTVRITNANPDPIELTGGSYVLYLDDVKVGKGLSSNRVSVPRLGAATDEVELYVDNIRLATQLMSLLEKEQVAYRLKAKLYLEGAFGTRRLRSTFEGTFSFDGES